LPTITQPVTIDGTTEPNSGGQPVIQIDGATAGDGAVGLQLTSAASGSTIAGLTVTDFSGGGVLLNGASNVTIANDDVGLVNFSTGALAFGNSGFGVELENGANHDTLTGDVISGNHGDGVVLTGSGTNSNTVQGSFLGTDPSGLHALANAWGVYVTGGASGNTFGGTTAGAGDIISGNGWTGIELNGVGTTGNVIAGDDIGTDSTGNAPLANPGAGVAISGGASGNTVSGDVISGNSLAGVWISDSSNNVVSGDTIGLGQNGTTALGNGQGVELLSGATGNTIGGTTAGARDAISANGGNGVRITGAGTNGNVVEGDDIGTNAVGEYGLVGNGGYGVSIDTGASDNTVGGTTYSGRDVISGNGASGVILSSAGTTGNVVEGDYIGIDALGEYRVANGVDGIDIVSGASSNVIGGTTTLARDVISGNAYLGVWLTGAGTSNNVVEGNDIGTDATSTAALGNGLGGVQIDSGASSNLIGGPSANDSNLIEFNGNGVGIGAGSFGNVIQFDIIDLNVGDGVLLAGASGDSVVDCTIEANGAWGLLDGGSNNYYAYNTLANNIDGSVGS
jgi:titin